MPDPFFASAGKKRKRTSQTVPSKALRNKGSKGTTAGLKRPQLQRKVARQDEELGSDATHSDIDDVNLRASEIDSGESDKEELAHETPAEKRLRLAKIYLDSVKEGLTLGDGEFDAAEIDKDIISARLKEDVLENAGKLHIFIADSLTIDEPPPPRLRVKGHRLAVTAAVLSHDACYLYTAGKEGSISSWDVKSGKRLACLAKIRQEAVQGKGKGKAREEDTRGHNDEVLALALSGDGKYLVSGGKDRRVGVWDVSGEPGGGNHLVWIKGFSGHKDAISGLSFRKSTNTLYSASLDRMIKVFDLSPGVMGYVETLFGHQDSVTGLDSLKSDSAVSCGGRDRTCRFWKIADETQLVFRGGGAGKARARDILEGLDEDENPSMDRSRQVEQGREKEERWIEGSIDCIAMVDEQTFVSGGDSGSIALWSTKKKKPLFAHAAAHGIEEINSSTEGILRRPRWITSLACMRYSDIFASGSWDSHIRLWKLDPSLKSFSLVGSLPASGLINSLQLLAMPKGWVQDEAWRSVQATVTTHRTNPIANGSLHPTVNGDVTSKPRNDEGALLVAGIGQEPRLGRWIKLKGEGSANSALIFALRRRKV